MIKYEVIFIIDRMVGGPDITIQEFGKTGGKRIIDQVQNIYTNILAQIKTSGQTYTDIKCHEYSTREPFWRIICYNGSEEVIRYSWIIKICCY